ncbi:hypothetical protein FRC00_002162 [Tulasnella sp. 408]|nr:hypothetical protein FRC00_002162 [Tulasnella sp. 408]
MCFGVTTPSNVGKYYWQCPEPCAWFRFLPRANSDLARDVAFYNPGPTPPGPPPHGPPPSYPGWDDATTVLMFPSSSPIASPTCPPNRPTRSQVDHALATVHTSAPPPISTAPGKLICSGCRKVANKQCQCNSCKACCAEQGGCGIKAHHQGRLLALAYGSQPVARTTPAARGGVLGDLINGPIDYVDNYPDEIDVPTSSINTSANPPTAPSTAPPPTSAPLPMLAPTDAARSTSSSQWNQSFACLLNPTWTCFLDSSKDTREKACWMEDAQQRQLIVDQITINVVVWFEAGVEAIQMEHSIPCRLSKEWQFREDAFLCDAAGIKKDATAIQKYCQNPDGRWWWRTFEITHPHSLLPGGFYFFAVAGLKSSEMPSFAELVGLAKVPNQNILGRNRNSAARAAPSSLEGFFLTTSLPGTIHSTAPPVRLNPRVLQQRVAKAQSSPLPQHQVEVVIPLHQKRPPGSPDQAKPEPKRRQASPELVKDSDSDDEVTSQLTTLRRWPQDFSVHEINEGLLAMQSKSGNQRQKFEQIFAVPFVKTTFTKYRNIWNAVSQEEKDSCLALPKQSQEALFDSIFCRI